MRFVFLIGLVVMAVLTRFLPVPPNFSPIIALALFSGVYFANKKFAFAVPMAAMLISDIFLGFHYDMFAVYASFALMVLLGTTLKKATVANVALSSIGGAVLFFVVTNFSVWITSGMYAHSFSGLMLCYEAAVPFFRNTVASALLYSAVMFGAYELSAKYLPALATTK